ncbi:MAG TPA: hypothetical protein PK876_00285 [Elusimicrobiota bacterium]|nr:hypothetical protein [Elusimicrobiota bacterium]
MKVELYFLKRIYLITLTCIIMSILIANTCLFADENKRPFWTEESVYIVEPYIYSVGIASNAPNKEQGRSVAFENGIKEILNTFQLKTLGDLVVETQMTYEEEKGGEWTTYRLLKVNLDSVLKQKHRNSKAEGSFVAYIIHKVTGDEKLPQTLQPIGQNIRTFTPEGIKQLENESQGVRNTRKTKISTKKTPTKKQDAVIPKTSPQGLHLEPMSPEEIEDLARAMRAAKATEACRAAALPLRYSIDKMKELYESPVGYFLLRGNAIIAGGLFGTIIPRLLGGKVYAVTEEELIKHGILKSKQARQEETLEQFRERKRLLHEVIVGRTGYFVPVSAEEEEELIAKQESKNPEGISADLPRRTNSNFRKLSPEEHERAMWAKKVLAVAKIGINLIKVAGAVAAEPVFFLPRIVIISEGAIFFSFG